MPGETFTSFKKCGLCLKIFCLLLSNLRANFCWSEVFHSGCKYILHIVSQIKPCLFKEWDKTTMYTAVEERDQWFNVGDGPIGPGGDVMLEWINTSCKHKRWIGEHK